MAHSPSIYQNDNNNNNILQPYQPYKIHTTGLPDVTEFKEDLKAVLFSPHASDETVELLVQDLGDDPSVVCITVGTCVPKPRCSNISQYGELCNKNDLSGGQIVSLLQQGGL